MRIISHSVVCNQTSSPLCTISTLQTNPEAPKHKPAIAWMPRVAHAPSLRDIDPLPHVRLIARTNKVVKASVEHRLGRKDAVIRAVHDGTLSREAVEDESCAFGGCGEGKERVVIGGIRGDDPGRRGGRRGVVPPLRKSQRRGGDEREGTYTEL